MNREEIMGVVLSRLQVNIEELANSLENYRAASDLDEGDTKDMEDFSQQSESIDMQRQLQIQLDHAQDLFASLNEAGEIVETDQNYFLLGFSIPSMHVGEKELLGVSPESPAYVIIKDKSKAIASNLATIAIR